MHRQILVSIFLCALASGVTWAQSPPAPVPTPVPQPIPEPAVAPIAPSPGQLGPWWRDSDLAAEIDLDDATVGELETLFFDYRLRLAELAADLERARAALDFARNRRDEDARRDAENALYDARSNLQTARAELMVEMRARLDAEQWEQLEQYRDRHHVPAPSAPVLPRVPRPAPVAMPAPAPISSPHPETPPRPPRPDARRGAVPSPAAPPAPPSAPLPPAPPALSWWTDASLRSELRLDDQQLKTLERTTHEAAPRLEDLQQQVRDAEQELSRLVGSQDLDRDAARRQVQRLASARRDLLDAGLELERRLFDVLTPEQRDRLNSW